MIEKIRRIRSFGSFVDFDWPVELRGFKRFNVFYGWNYSGKTMLSRIFRCFENKALHPDFPSAEAQIIDTDNTVYSLAAPDTSLEFRVFNRDFVDKNLFFDTGKTIPILILGADITRQDELNRKNEHREALETLKKTAAGEKEGINATIEKALTTKASDAIKNPLAVPSYDKTKLRLKVDVCKDAPEEYRLDDESAARYIQQYLSIDKKDTLTELSVPFVSLGELRARVKTSLAKSVTNQQIPRLANNPAAEKWVDSGRHLHENLEACLFCGQPLPPGLLDALKQHFSEQYDLLMDELKRLGDEIEEAKKEQLNLPHATEFYSEQAAQYQNEKQEVERLEKERLSALTSLADAVETKRTKAFTALECPEAQDPKDQITQHVTEINRLITQHNLRTTEFEGNRRAAFSKLELHAAATFVIEQNYVACLSKSEGLQSQIEKADEEIIGLNRDILRLQAELSEAVKGAERINELLKAYFGKEDLRIQVSEDKQFQIVRDRAIAKNLSEGEKTAIAFAHFIARIQDGKTPLANTIVVIDDPISSLDTNHLFNTYALIKTQIAGCKQLFLLTHNLELFNLVKDWGQQRNRHIKDHEKWKDWSFYLVVRADSLRSRIESIPPELMRFKSEYHYLFGELYRFANGKSAGFDRLFTLPNITRRFMEAFGGMMIPNSDDIYVKLGSIIKDAVMKERVWKFINQYSHQTNEMRSITIPDVSECDAVVKACLTAVRAWDEKYFLALESEVS